MKMSRGECHDLLTHVLRYVRHDCCERWHKNGMLKILSRECNPVYIWPPRFLPAGSESLVVDISGGDKDSGGIHAQAKFSCRELNKKTGAESLMELVSERLQVACQEFDDKAAQLGQTFTLPFSAHCIEAHKERVPA